MKVVSHQSFRRSQFSASSLTLRYKNSTVSPRNCFAIRRTCLSNVLFRCLMNASSTIFQNSAVVSDNNYMWIVAVENSMPFQTNTMIE